MLHKKILLVGAGAKQKSPLEIINSTNWRVGVTVGGRAMEVAPRSTANIVAPVGEVISLDALDWNGGIPEPMYSASKNVRMWGEDFTILYPDGATFISIGVMWG